jgi:hypothetical protein
MRYKRIETYQAHAKLTQHTQGGIDLKVVYTSQGCVYTIEYQNYIINHESHMY